MEDFKVYGLDGKKLLVRFELTEESMHITTNGGLIICDIGEAIDLRDWLSAMLAEMDAHK